MAKKRRKSAGTKTSAAPKRTKKKAKGSRSSGGGDSVDAGVQKAMNSFLPPEAKAQHERGEAEFRRAYL